MTNTPEQAITKAAAQSLNGPTFQVGTCLRQVRTCYAVAAQYPSAAEAWTNAKLKHRTTDIQTIPRGAPVFWTGGSQGFGHIAIASGKDYCWSTDILRNGYFDHVPIATIRNKWGMTLVGWTEDLNSVRVWSPPAAQPKPPTEPEAHVHLRNAWTNGRNVNTADLSAIRNTGRQPYADAARAAKNAIDQAMRTYFEETD